MIATDLDGTLFYPKKTVRLIPTKNRKLLQRFQNDGGRILVVTGRSLFFGEKVARKIKGPVDLVGCNGSFVRSDGQTIFEKAFDSEYLKEIFGFIRRELNIMFVGIFCKHNNFVINTNDLGKLPRLGYALYELFIGTYREPCVKSSKVFYEEVERGEVYKGFIFVGITGKAKRRSERYTQMLSERFPEAVFSWCGQAIEITPKGCTKSSGISFYLDYNKINKDNIVVVGDSGNDISMFEAFKENSFCMGHGPASVKAHAAHQIKHFYDLGDYIYPSAEKDPERSNQKKG